MSAENNRNEVLDVVRIIATLLVIGVHALGSIEQYVPTSGFSRVEYVFFSILSRAGVPIFLVLSGWFLLNKPIDDVWNFYKKRLKRILIPYMAYAVFYTCYFVGYEEHQPVQIPKQYVLRLIEGRVHPVLWFVYTILVLYFLTPFLSKMLLNMTAKEKRILAFGIIAYELLVSALKLVGVSLGITSMFLNDSSLFCFLLGGIAYQTPCTERKGINHIVCLLSIILFIATKEYGVLYICLYSGFSLIRDIEGKRFKVLEAISNQTYSIYLIHAAVISALLKVQSFHAQWIGFEMILFVIEIFIISGLSTWMVEFIPKRILTARKKNA